MAVIHPEAVDSTRLLGATGAYGAIGLIRQLEANRRGKTASGGNREIEWGLVVIRLIRVADEAIADIEIHHDILNVQCRRH